MNNPVEKIRVTLTDKPFFPMLLIAVGVSLFAFGDVVHKFLSADLTPFSIAFWNDIFALFAVLLFAKPLGGVAAALASPRKPFHFARSLCLTIGWLLILAGIARMPLADTYSLMFSWPIFATILAALLLGEKVLRHHWISIVGGFCGVMLILRPGTGIFDTDMIFPLAAAGFFAAASIFSRLLPPSETKLSFALYPILVTLAVSGGGMLATSVQLPNILSLTLLAVSGTLSGFAVIMVGMAFSRGNTAVVAPFEYLKMLWAVVFGYLVFGDVPDPLMMAGAALIIASGMYLMVMERRA